jgi:hypothetical protein
LPRRGLTLIGDSVVARVSSLGVTLVEGETDTASLAVVVVVVVTPDLLPGEANETLLQDDLVVVVFESVVVSFYYGTARLVVESTACHDVPSTILRIRVAWNVLPAWKTASK